MAKEEGGGAETGEKEGQNLLGEPTFKKLENGRFKCVETGYELPAHGRDSYARSKHCRLGLIDAALASKKPPLNMFSQDPLSNDPEEAEFWMPPVGERWDFDDGPNRWGSGSESEPENDDANGEDELIEEATHEAGELSKQYVQNLFTFHESWTKRMTLEIGPSSFAQRKKKKTNAS
nr:surfeit locus protein 2 [Ipomoea batatas]